MFHMIISSRQEKYFTVFRKLSKETCNAYFLISLKHYSFDFETNEFKVLKHYNYKIITHVDSIKSS